MLRARLAGEATFGGWALGRWGVPINAYALLYTVWMAVFTCFPQYLPVTGTNFNYASPIYLFVVFVALGLWFAWGKKKWPGLNKEIIDVVLADSERNTTD